MNTIELGFPVLTPAFTWPPEIYVVFHPSRGTIIGVRAEQAESAPVLSNVRSVETSEVNGGISVLGTDVANAFKLQGRSGDAFTPPPTVTVSYFGEAPEIIRWTFPSDDNNWTVIYADGEACPEQPNYREPIRVPDRETALVSPRKYGDALRAELENPRLVHRKDRQRFAHLDSLTNPKFSAEGARESSLRAAIQTLAPSLRRRLKLRARLWERGDPTAASHLVGEVGVDLRDCVAIIADSLRLTLGPNALETDAAVVRFANGELRLELLQQFPGVWTTQPSSANFFLLAEFSFLAIYFGVDKTYWGRLANAMTRAQRAYCRAYPPATSNPGFGDYRSCNYIRGSPYTEPEKIELAREYKDFPLSSLMWDCGRNAANAFGVSGSW